MIIRSEAIVLRSMEYSESSRIATLLTRQQGKVAVIAKGARRTNSRFGSTLMPMAYVQAVYYVKPARSLQTLSECSHVLRWRSLGRDLDRISVGLKAVELVHAMVQDQQDVPMVFNLTLQALRTLDRPEVSIRNVWPFFQLRLAGVLGFAPDLDRDTVRELPESGGFLSLERGSVSSTGSRSRTCLPASRSALRAFGVLALTDLETTLRMNLDEPTLMETSRLVEDYLRYHVQESYPDRASKVLRQLSSGPATAPE
jgi:DNA repair protein RecO (recombination protein O)